MTDDRHMGTNCAIMAQDEPSPSATDEQTKSALADLPEVLTVEQVLKLLPVGRTVLYEALRSGQIPSGRVGRRYVIARETLVKLLKL